MSEEQGASLQQRHVVDSDLANYVSKNPGRQGFILSMANQNIRSHYLDLANSLHLEPQSIIHPQTSVSPSARIGKGTYLAPGCRVSAQASVGDHSIINFNVTYGHNTKSGMHLIANPGATIGGNVTIGNRVLVGANAFIHQGLNVEDDCQIDALTHVGNNLLAGTLCTSRQFKTFPRRDI